MKTAFVKRLLAIRLFGCVGLTALMLATVLRADPLLPGRDTYIQLRGCQHPPACEVEEDSASMDPSNPVSIDQTFTGSNYVLTAVGFPISSYGVLHASSYVSVSTSNSNMTARLDSRADFHDLITITFPPFTGRTGYLVIDYTLNGLLSGTGGGDPGTGVGVCVTPDDCQGAAYNNPPSSSHTVSGVFSFDPFPFTYGQQFELAFALIADATVDDSGTASSDFANTLTRSGLHPFGPDMQPVTGATFTSISGTQYGPNGVISATPEPSSSVLVAAALAILLGAGFRRRIRYAERFRRASNDLINCIRPNVA